MSEMHRTGADAPEALASLFNQRANAGDVEGLVALYEPDAVLAAGRVVATGHAEIRAFYADLLARRSDFPPAKALPPLRNGPLAMTFARLPNGTISVETAREQADGTWLWVIDQLKIKPSDPQSLFEGLHRPSPSVSCSNTGSAWRGGVESRCGRTGIGRAMRRA